MPQVHIQGGWFREDNNALFQEVNSIVNLPATEGVDTYPHTFGQGLYNLSARVVCNIKGVDLSFPLGSVRVRIKVIHRVAPSDWTLLDEKTVTLTNNTTWDINTVNTGNDKWAELGFMMAWFNGNLDTRLQVTETGEVARLASTPALPYDSGLVGGPFTQNFVIASLSPYFNRVVVSKDGVQEGIHDLPWNASLTAPQNTQTSYILTAVEPDFAHEVTIFVVDGGGNAFRVGDCSLQQGIYNFDGYLNQEANNAWVRGWKSVLIRSKDGKALPPGRTAVIRYNSAVETIPPTIQQVQTQPVEAVEGSSRFPPIFIGTKMFPGSAPAFDLVLSGITKPLTDPSKDGAIQASSDPEIWTGINVGDLILNVGDNSTTYPGTGPGTVEPINDIPWTEHPVDELQETDWGTAPDIPAADTSVCQCSPWYVAIARQIQYLTESIQVVSTKIDSRIRGIEQQVKDINTNFEIFAEDLGTLSSASDQVSDSIADATAQIGDISVAMESAKNSLETIANSIDNPNGLVQQEITVVREPYTKYNSEEY